MVYGLTSIPIHSSLFYQKKINTAIMSDDSSTSSTESIKEETMEEITDLNNSDVCTKYQEASKIVNLALMGLIEQCIVGAKILDLCKVSTT